MMTSLKVPTFENYEWLKSVRWAPPKTIFRQGDVGKGVGPIPKVIANPMIVLRSGVWLLPYWREPHDAAPCSNLTCPRDSHERWWPARVVRWTKTSSAAFDFTAKECSFGERDGECFSKEES